MLEIKQQLKNARALAAKTGRPVVVATQVCPYGFDGDWSVAERAMVCEAVDPHIPKPAGTVFNGWRFIKINDNRFMARRLTWVDGFIYAKSASELARKVDFYYTRQFAILKGD